MKTLILSAWTENISDLAKITSATKEEYAALHGYQYLGHIFSSDSTEHPSWRKLKLFLDLLPTVDRLLWIDADSYVSNPMISLDQIPYIEGLTASRDWSVNAGPEHFCGSAMILTPHALPLVERAYLKTHWANFPFWDQSALREASLDFKNYLRVLPRRALNAVPQELRPWAAEPWEPHDFLCHLTCIKNEERFEFLRKNLPSHFSFDFE
ncbi:MAG: hypothetical protein K2W99_04290 [Chthoniobacterales bacterium]|nr:hypothetical protein [Chthoniobacterales bacterium]